MNKSTKWFIVSISLAFIGLMMCLMWKIGQGYQEK